MDSGNPHEKVEISPTLAHAILDMDDHGYSEGLGPENNGGMEAWRELVSKAEQITGRKSLDTRGRERIEKTRGASAS